MSARTEIELARSALAKLVTNLRMLKEEGGVTCLWHGMHSDRPLLVGSEIASIRSRAVQNLHDKLFLTQLIVIEDLVHDRAFLSHLLVWFQFDDRVEVDDLRVADLLAATAKVCI
jgi:hypothetical protein